MADQNRSYAQTIADLVAIIEESERSLADDKRTVNRLCERQGVPPRYPEVDIEKAVGGGTFRKDQFYGKALATAIREFLEVRGPSDRGGRGAATVNEIYEALSAGGFKFETKDDLNAKRGLRIALTKNSVTFHRVPHGGSGGDAYGLLEWYPNARPEKSTEDVPVSKTTKAKPGAKSKTVKVGRLPKGRLTKTDPQESKTVDANETSTV